MIELLREHAFIIFAVIVQIICILTPLTIKNWDDDIINAITYVSIQGLICLILFSFIPWIFDIKSAISNLVLGYLVSGTILISWLRIVRMIPIEGTSFETAKPIVIPLTNFKLELPSEKLKMLANINFKQPDADGRYRDLREKLLRVAVDIEIDSEKQLLLED